MTFSENLWLFSLLVAGIIVVPGMDMLFVLASSLSGGRRTGLAATAGMVAGGAVHTLYGTLGAGLVVAFAPWLFKPMLFAGCLYMAWIGWSLIRSSIRVDGVGRTGTTELFTAFRRGLATCLLNPKAYMFVIAVYPQFLKPALGPLWIQGLAMAGVVAAAQAGIYGTVALAGDKARAALVQSPAATIWLGRGAGGLLLLVTALTLWQVLGRAG